MNEHHPIIDVTPVDHSSSRIHADGNWRAPGSTGACGSARSYQGSAANGQAGACKPANMLGGVVQAVLGGVLILVGIPMLVLPGPGLLSIAAGTFLVARGVSQFRG